MSVVISLSNICYECPCPNLIVEEELTIQGRQTVVRCKNVSICGHIECYIRRIIAKEKKNDSTDS